MAGGTIQQQQQQQQQQAPQLAPPSSTSSSTAPTTTPEEDEFLKRNTDCVYFLASPLTCKKGSECEYRHSDIARVNPRDCWYWLNGNCLNPKCAFRHPPLDGLLGADVSTPMAPSVVPTPHAAPYGAPKQGVACIFFQKGFCLKGHLCPFLHGPSNSINNKAPQSGSVNPVTEQPPKVVSSGPDKSIQEQQKFTPAATLQKPVEFPPPKGKQTHIPARNGATFNKREPLEEPPRYKPARVVPPPVMDVETPNPSVYHGCHVSENDRILNGKDADEYSREPSPGFDVLVDNELGDSEFYHEKDEFVRSRGQDYDVDRPEYDVDYREHRDYDHYNEQDNQFAWDDRRASSERILVGSAHLERRPYPRNESDLRHRILKQRRVSENGLTSVVTRENYGDRRDRDRERDSRHHHRQDQGALSSRLRGRIKIPGRSMSPTRENVTRVEKEIDIGRRHQSRYSPGRPLSLNQSRLRDRIKDNNGDDVKFAGPKRLSELKSGRTTESLEDGQLLGKRKTENDLSFEGPKPLSEILKRKKGTETRISSVITHKEREIIPETTKKEEQNTIVTDFEPEKQIGLSNTENATSADDNGKSSLNDDEIQVEKDEDALLDEELEAYDHKDGEYDYDQIDGEEDYNLDEEGEFVDEDEYEKKELVENNEY